MCSVKTKMISRKLIERLERLHPKIIDLSLDRLNNLLNALDNPQKRLPPIIHVAGTNGKGSTIAILRSIQNAAGLSIHAYTSPHLVHLNERFIIAGKEITEKSLIQTLTECENANAGAEITFFEIITAAGLLAFSKIKADLLLLEVGLGGRFDATNVVSNPILSIITPISLDHQQYLGDTLEKIAYEKAGILKEKRPAIIGQQGPEALKVIKLKAEETGSPLFIFQRDWNITETKSAIKFEVEGSTSYFEKPNLKGIHQIQNAGIAIAATHYLKEVLPIKNGSIDQGLLTVKWPARLQKINEGPLINILPTNVELWIDGGHNQNASLLIAHTIRNWKIKNPCLSIHMVFGCLSNRETKALLQPFINIIDLVQTVKIPEQANSASRELVAHTAKSMGFRASPADTVAKAIKNIISLSAGKRLILIYGSLYLSGSVLADNS
ncbi:bifunctional folylpolyglutamate synthase/dihydrofolate synthase [Rhodospirillaceae bacterium]|nr:bifunctional folylpolyglutamate synthase/dihydrofolate synthase [Rhodospirillaceae bacterium]MDC1442529.1 bifunctional folylpolyglutamate synthase/dihydrofolate synthase [Rhodospirillaceae bacterium]